MTVFVIYPQLYIKAESLEEADDIFYQMISELEDSAFGLRFRYKGGTSMEADKEHQEIFDE